MPPFAFLEHRVELLLPFAPFTAFISAPGIPDVNPEAISSQHNTLHSGTTSTPLYVNWHRNAFICIPSNIELSCCFHLHPLQHSSQAPGISDVNPEAISSQHSQCPKHDH
ncbi:hypothetical protein CDAR_577501 [Caerostris darwini]|uniref:Uncharacterized protein n=1 Tax=Caerostris darwini TaxID=1538125 RepID=A0AAV4QEB1_9ARAC|nr:hypothetical protein CDAR_577501 [Caerostris darwini]